MVTVRFLSLKNDLEVEDKIEIYGSNEITKLLNDLLKCVSDETLFYEEKKEKFYKEQIEQINEKMITLIKRYKKLTKLYNCTKSSELRIKLRDVQESIEHLIAKKQRIKKLIRENSLSKIHKVCEVRKNLIYFLNYVNFHRAREFEESNRFNAIDFEYSGNEEQLVFVLKCFLKKKEKELIAKAQEN